MVRSGGKLVAATIALLEGRPPRPTNSSNVSGSGRERPVEARSRPLLAEHVDSSSMDESTLKCSSSSTDSGKDDNSITTTSTSSSASEKNSPTRVVELSTVCCEEDFEWLGSRREERGGSRREERVGARREERGVNLRREDRRKTSSSLERGRRSSQRRERDTKARSTGRIQDLPCRHYPPPPLHHFYPLYPHCQCQPLTYYKPTSDVEEQVRRLESEKESLSLQVAVLTDQVDAQAEKITDLERSLNDHKRQISSSEDLLQREMLTRSSLETQKLELLAVVSELKRHSAVLERENTELRERLAEERRRSKPPLAPRAHLYPATSTPTSIQLLSRGVSPSPSPVLLGQTQRKGESDLESTPVLQRVGGGGYRSLPRETDATPKRGVVFGRASLSSEQPRCSSVPNLAETESVVINDSEVDGTTYSQEPSPSMQTSAPKGLRKIFGKVKRSGSGNLDDLTPDDSFTRGGVRSTAGPRLCTNNSQNSLRNELAFADWSVDMVCEWLKDLGLEGSVNDAKRWVKTGATLLNASPQEVDKELNLKKNLVRKKLHLALGAVREGSSTGGASRLEPAWVLRWLDDIGLPQYKHSFMSARLDGRMLHRLTLDDVHALHISSALHLASIRTGIHVLRKKQFDPGCLIRRSDPESESQEEENQVELWTNHRVMEWLKVVDLAEYAPNLRGSGVHGGLMVHEERFTATLLASLLSIPPEKTLLRRHLSTHFTQLLGAEVIQAKRQAETSLGYTPLTTSLKIKVPKKSQFTLKRKKSKFDLDDGELVCPLNENGKNSQTAEVSKPRGCLS